MSRIPVAILGATGMVGQRLIQRLSGHPWFQVAAVAASSRSVGRPYGEVVPWRLPGTACDDRVARMDVLPCEPGRMPRGLRVVLSALGGPEAGEIEGRFQSSGFAVISNASAWRDDPLVPLLVPEVNPEHVALVQKQPGLGYIVTNPNCCVVPLVIALAPLHREMGIQALVVSTYQAVSGAGYPGESAWDMLGNVHPHPGDEELKVQTEPLKILGATSRPADFPVSARCVRVPVVDGHLISVQVKLRGHPSPEAVAALLESSYGDLPTLPSTPRPLLLLTRQRDRPAPRFDADSGNGMAVTVGRIECCPVMGIKLFCLAHNTIRGAAGAAIANLELLRSKGLLP